MSLTSSHTSLAILLLLTIFTSPPPPCTVVNALGTTSTTAVVLDTRTVCGILAGETTQRIQCYQNNQIIQIQPNVSFESISGGSTFFCGLRSGGYSILCWNTYIDSSYYSSSFQPKRIYYSKTVGLTDLTVGDGQVCARVVTTGSVKCWRGEKDGSMFPEPEMHLKFIGITSGSGFTCGVLTNKRKVHCWGHNAIAVKIQKLFSNFSMSSLVAGVSHACGLTTSGDMICKGDSNSNNHGELDVPFSSAFEFSSWGIALGANFSCAIRQRNGLVVCWGGETNRFEYDSSVVENVSFETIVSGIDFVCGLRTWNLTVICWGPGWSIKSGFRNDLGLGMIIPGPCVKSSCSISGTYPNSDRLCDGSGNICRQCQFELPLALPLPPMFSPPSNESKPISPPPGRSLNGVSKAFAIVGSVGAFIGICTIAYFLWANACGWFGKNSDSGGEPPSSGANLESAEDHNCSNAHSPRPGSYTGLGLGSLTEKFSLAELAAATSDFSNKNKIGSGSFGIVYKGTLSDCREVAIKRGEIDTTKIRKFQEKESAFGSELALLSRLHHKHLVGLVGYCQEEHERLLVYEFMSNGALHDHLHSKENIDKSSSILNSWKMRIKIALDAARGVEYLHDYAVPPIIHRDIKSSNILLDSNWTARVSDFGLSLMGPEPDQDHMSSKAVGTVGYIDPEYYAMNVLTTKSDVYGLGVVLLELLTGKRAVFRNEGGTGPMGVVEYAVPLITVGQVQMLLDQRVEPPINGEAKAVELVANTALRCVNLEGRERPNVAEIVADLEKAYSLCAAREKRHATFSISISSEC